MTTCPHEQIESAGITPDTGGRVHELAECRRCGTRLHRVSPLHDWSPTDDLPARLIDS